MAHIKWIRSEPLDLEDARRYGKHRAERIQRRQHNLSYEDLLSLGFNGVNTSSANERR